MWLYEIFQQIESRLDKETLQTLMNSDPQDLSRFHFTLGVWIRNTFLQENSTAYTALRQAGIPHPDDMSTFIIDELYKFLHSQ